MELKHNSQKFTMRLANKIVKAIWEYQENFHPNIFENVFIVGGVLEHGYSFHDIDITILWNFDAMEAESELEYIKKIVAHLVNYWLKLYGFPIDRLDIYCYVRYGSYNLDFGGWNTRVVKPPSTQKTD